MSKKHINHLSSRYENIWRNSAQKVWLSYTVGPTYKKLAYSESPL